MTKQWKKDELKGMMSLELAEQLYYNKRMSVIEIANVFKIKPTTTRSVLIDYGITLRKQGQGGKKEELCRSLDINRLTELYAERHLSIRDIAKLYSKSPQTILNLMIKYNIPRREAIVPKKYKELDASTMWELYCQKGMSQSEIGKKLNMPSRSVSSYMSYFDIAARKNPRRDLIQEAVLVDMHKRQRYCTKEIADYFGLSQKCIYNYLRSYKIPVDYGRAPNINIEFFRNESSDFYYFLGVILTDGCISKGVIQLGMTDRGVVEYIAKVISYENKISKIVSHRKTPIYHLAFKNVKVNEILAQYGLVERKSKILKYPTIPIEYKADFLRGVLDGDGSVEVIYMNRRGELSGRVTFYTCSNHFIEGIKADIEILIGGNRNIYCTTVKEPGLKFYRYSMASKKDLIKLYDCFYGKGEFGMSRKKEVLSRVVLEGDG